MAEVERQRITTKDLALQLETTSHSAESIERVLAAFIDPNMETATREGFFRRMSSSLIGRSKRVSHVSSAINSVNDDISWGRQFNATYIGHELSESAIPAIIATAIAARNNGNTVAREVSRPESALEPEAIGALLELVGFDPEVGSGTFTSGGSLANMTALAVARKLEEEAAINEKRPVGKLAVLTTPFAHYSVKKVCDLLGGPNHDIQVIEVDSEDLRMSLESLQDKITEAQNNKLRIMAVVAMAGETETGLVDPIKSIADITDQHNLRLVVDGAYGTPYKLSRAGDKLAGIERAFAITIDPHKTLYTPYPSGVTLFRDAKEHSRIGMGIDAPYLQFLTDADELAEAFRGRRQSQEESKLNLGQKRIEGSMGTAPILSTVAVLRTLGTEGLGILYDLTLDRTQHLYQRLSSSKYLAPIHIPDLNLLCFTLRDEIVEALGITRNDKPSKPMREHLEKQGIFVREEDTLQEFIETTRRELDNDIQREGGYFFSGTNLPLDTNSEVEEIDENGNPTGKNKSERNRKYAYRACIMHPRTTNEIIDNAVQALEVIIESKIREKNPQ